MKHVLFNKQRYIISVTFIRKNGNVKCIGEAIMIHRGDGVAIQWNNFFHI